MPSPYRGIETNFKGIEFRSRLEARWAYFFELCGWPWSYEPMDFKGWIPDFAIGERGTLVECKPFFALHDFKEQIEKIKSSGCDREVLLLKADPTMDRDMHDGEGPIVGWWLDPGAEPFMNDLWGVNLGITEGNGRLGICSMQGAWFNGVWITPPNISHPNKWSRVSLTTEQFEQRVMPIWAEACNVTKWKRSA